MLTAPTSELTEVGGGGWNLGVVSRWSPSFQDSGKRQCVIGKTVVLECGDLVLDWPLLADD